MTQPPPYPGGDADEPTPPQPAAPTGQPPAQPAGYPPPAPAPLPGSREATISLVTGILGVVFCVLLGIVAIITGRQATTLAAAAGLPQPGTAKAGIILGWVSIALAVAGILLVVVLFALFGVAATMSGSEFGGTELSG